MNNTKTSCRFAAFSGFLIALSIVLAGCATSSARDDLEQGQALIAAGRVREANVLLTRAHAAHPEDQEIDSTLGSVRLRLATLLISQGDAAMSEGRLSAAESSYRELATIPGFVNTSTERLSALKQRKADQQFSSTAAMATSSRPTLSAPSLAMSSAQSSVSAAPVSAVVTPVAVAMPSASSASSVAASSVAAPMPVAAAAQSSSAAPAPVMQSASSAANSTPVPVAAQAATSAPARSVTRNTLSVLDEALSRKVNLEFRDAPVKSLFDAVGKSSGLNIVIDKDVQNDLRTSIFLRDTTVRNALDKIVLTTHLAWRPMDENTLIIYPDEIPKQQDYQGLVVRGFHLANADAKFVANSLRTILKFRDIVVDDKLNMIVVRDTPQAIALAEQLIALHDVPEPEVMLEVAILEVTKGKLQNLGVAWPTSATLTPLARTVQGAASTQVTTTATTTTTSSNQLTLRDLYNLTPASTLLSINGATLNASATDTDVNILGNPRIRAKNKEKAKILIGERVPNISATATSNGVVSQNINYVDVGLKLEVEPQILPGNEINLKLALEVSSINSTVENATNGTVAYRIGTRTASTVLRLKDGENQVLGGLIQDSDRKTVSKVPLLGDIPLLGRLFRSDSTDKEKTEVVLSITPHLVRGIDKPTAKEESFDAGTITSVRGRRGDADNNIPVVQDSTQPAQQNQQQGGGDQPQATRRVRTED